MTALGDPPGPPGTPEPPAGSPEPPRPAGLGPAPTRGHGEAAGIPSTAAGEATTAPSREGAARAGEGAAPAGAGAAGAGEATARAGEGAARAGEATARAGEGAVAAGEAVVGTEDAGRRLDEVVAAAAGVSRARAARWAAAGLVLVDGRPRPKSHRLLGGERLAWAPPPPAPGGGRPAAEDLPLEVRYEDDRLLVVAKPAGLVVHPGPGHPTGTLVNALLGRAGTALSSGGEAGRPGIVHRLDKETSGLLLVAKDDAAHLALSRDLAARRVERRYLALVQGRLPAATGTVDRPVGRHPRDRKRMAVVAKGGRAAVTHWRVLETFPAVQLVEATLETGRTHQVRVHLAAARHPVVGDRTYGADPSLAARLGVDRPFLHAWRLAFRHPADGRTVELTEPLPPDLRGVLDRLGASEWATSS